MLRAVRIPPPPALFVGRDAELARLKEGLARVSVAVICGVAGVGKSALAAAFAASWPGPMAYARVGSEVTFAELCGDVARQLGCACDDPAAVAESLDDHHALWVLDDLHRLAPAERHALLYELGARLRAGKVLATSRQLLPFEPDAPDRLEVKLGGLDSTSAQLLWASLDELQGVTPGFEGMWSKARGNPLLLRQAHACRPLAEDHIATAVRSLTDAERQLATAFALCELPLPTRVIDGLTAGGRAVLDALVTRLVVDPAGPELWQLHDLFREALLADLAPASREAGHVELARLLADADLDPVLRAREVCRHLRAVDRVEDCAAYLLAQEPALLREGAAGELLRALDALPAERRPPHVTVSLARTRGRMLDLERAQRELEQLIARGPEHAIAEAWLVLGQVALLRGELATAVDALAQLERCHDATELVRRLGTISAAIVDTHRGMGDRGRERLAVAERETTDADTRGVLVLFRGMLAWLDELDDQLDDMLRPNEWFTGCVAALRANVVAPGLAAALCTRLGRLDEAEMHYALASAALRRDDDLLSRITLAHTRATLDLERGNRITAEMRLREVLAEPRLNVTSKLMCDALRVRVLLALGRRRAACDLADETLARARALGLVAIANQVDRSAAHDVVAQLRARLPAWGGHAVRAAALAAIHAAAAGEPTRFAPPDGPDYAVERALGHIARALAARLDGREPEAADELARATGALADDGADVELVDAMLDAIGRVRAITPAGRSMVRDEVARELTADLIVDARAGELRSTAGVVALHSRPLVGKLLCALASRPRRAWTKDALCQLLWGAPFDPLVHDNPLKVSITRGRALLGEAAGLEHGADGYRLRTPDSFLYLDVPTSNPV